MASSFDIKSNIAKVVDARGSSENKKIPFVNLRLLPCISKSRLESYLEETQKYHGKSIKTHLRKSKTQSGSKAKAFYVLLKEGKSSRWKTRVRPKVNGDDRNCLQ